jgi:hypothetical protein
LWGKLLYAVIVERLAMKRCGSPWAQMHRARRATWWRVWQMLSKEIQEMILKTTAWSELDWQALKQSLCERRRQRRLRRLPDKVRKWLLRAGLTQAIQLV